MKRVLTVGVFDYFHYGHFKLFENAKKLGDYLIVAVQDGDYILKYKPDAKVMYSTEQRMELVGALRDVDKTVVYFDVDKIVQEVDFDIFAIGGDHKHAGFQRAVKWCEENGKEVIRLPRTPGICSSEIKTELSAGKKYHIGYTCGVFDCLHVGHLNLLERCKEMCDILIVGVCDDDYVRNIKHKEPVYTQEERVRILNSLSVVDRAELVDIETTNDKMLAIDKFHFDVLFSGDDWKGSERYKRTEKQFAELGASIEYFPYTKGVSTTEIKEKISHGNS